MYFCCFSSDSSVPPCAPAAYCGVMGSSTSSQLPPPGDGRHPLFCKGVTALSEGRNTLWGPFFHQATVRHPGRAFWDELLAAAEPQKNKLKGGFEEESKNELPPVTSTPFKEILLPLDNKFADLNELALLVI
jgi:hypothetical protein